MKLGNRETFEEFRGQTEEKGFSYKMSTEVATYPKNKVQAAKSNPSACSLSLCPELRETEMGPRVRLLVRWGSAIL